MKIMTLLFLLSFTSFAQALLNDTDTLDSGMSPKDYYSSHYHSNQNCESEFQKLNSDLAFEQALNENKIIYLPENENCITMTKSPDKTKSIANKKPAIIKELPKEDLNHKNTFKNYFLNLSMGVSYYLTNIKGENLENAGKLDLVSDNHIAINLNASFHFDKWNLHNSFITRKISFQNNLDTTVKNADQNLSEYNLLMERNISRHFSLLINTRAAESVFHQNDNGAINLFKIQKISGEIGLKWQKNYADKINSSVSLMAGQSDVIGDGGESVQGGMQYQGKIRLETLNKKKNFYLEFHHQRQIEESNEYKQELIFNGVQAGLTFDF